MLINTIDGKEFNTDTVRDDKAELIEKIEKSGIRDFVVSRNGCCFVWAKLADGGWVTTHMTSAEHVNQLVSVVREIVEASTKGEYSLAFAKK